jgi:hypothetical protein
VNLLPFLIVLIPGLGFVLCLSIVADDNLRAALIASHVCWMALLVGLCMYGVTWYMRRMRRTWTVTAMIFALMTPCGILIGNLMDDMPKVITNRDAELMSILGLLGATCGAIFLYAGELSAIGRKELRARRRKLLESLV